MQKACTSNPTKLLGETLQHIEHNKHTLSTLQHIVYRLHAKHSRVHNTPHPDTPSTQPATPNWFCDPLDGHYDATDAWLGLGWPWSVLPVPGSWQVYWSKAGPTPGLVQVFRLFYKICPRWHASLMMLVSPTGSRSQGIISVQETVNLASFC